MVPVSPKQFMVAAGVVSVLVMLSLAQMSQLAIPGDALHGYKLWTEDITFMGTIDKLERRVIELDHLTAGLASIDRIAETVKLMTVTASFVQCALLSDVDRLVEVQDYVHTIFLTRGDIMSGFYSATSLATLGRALRSLDLSLETAIRLCV